MAVNYSRSTWKTDEMVVMPADHEAVLTYLEAVMRVWCTTDPHKPRESS